MIELNLTVIFRLNRKAPLSRSQQVVGSVHVCRFETIRIDTMIERADFGRVLCGIQVPPSEMRQFKAFLKDIGYPCTDETANQVRQALAGIFDLEEKA